MTFIQIKTFFLCQCVCSNYVPFHVFFLWNYFFSLSLRRNIKMLIFSSRKNKREILTFQSGSLNVVNFTVPIKKTHYSMLHVYMVVSFNSVMVRKCLYYNIFVYIFEEQKTNQLLDNICLKIYFDVDFVQMKGLL